jgi:hypothetical protein
MKIEFKVNKSGKTPQEYFILSDKQCVKFYAEAKTIYIKSETCGEAITQAIQIAKSPKEAYLLIYFLGYLDGKCS